MSFSVCIKCRQMVSYYEKYCPDCVSKYGVRQDETFHKRVYLDSKDYEAEFQKDFQLRTNPTYLKEGSVRKGGLKPIPFTPKPDIKPAGQNPKRRK